MSKTLLFAARVLPRISCIFILLCNLFVLCVYAYLRCNYFDAWHGAPVELMQWQKILLVAAIVTYAIVGVFFYWPRKERQGAVPSRFPIYRGVFTLLSIGLFFYLTIDGAPPKTTYTREYLEPKDPSISQPTKALNTLFYAKKEDVPDLKHLNRDRKYQDIEAYTAEIEGAWKYIAGQRGAVDTLAGHNQFLHEIEANVFAPVEYSAFGVGAIYQSNVLLRARQGDVEGAVKTLLQFHDVTRKGLQGAVNLMQKMLWIANATHNMRTAFQLAYEYDLDEPIRLELASAFAPFTDEEASFFKPWIGEYFEWQMYLDLSFTQLYETRWHDPGRSVPYRLAKLLPEPVVAFLFRLTRQKNRSAQLLQDFWEPVIHTAMSEGYGLHVHGEEDWYSPITLRNVGGWYMFQPPFFFMNEKRMQALEKKSALLHNFILSKENLTVDAMVELSLHGLGGAQGGGKLAIQGDRALELYYPVESRR